MPSGDGGGFEETDLRPDADSGELSVDRTEQLYTLLRQLGLASAPQHQALARQGQQLWTQEASGSPAALMAGMLPQIRQLRDSMQQAFTGLSRRLGPGNRAAIDKGRADILAQGGAQLSRALTGKQQQGTAGLLRFLESLRPSLLTQLPQPTSQSQEAPFNYQALGQALASAGGVAGRLWPTGGGATDMALLNTQYAGFTPAQSAPLAGAGSGYGDFATYGM